MDPIEYAKFLFTQIFNKQDIVTQRAKSVYDIDYKALKKKGVKLLIFDVDDTLAGNKTGLPEKSKELLTKLSRSPYNFRLAILSNCSRKRFNKLKDMVKALDIYVEEKNNKPDKKGYLSIMEHFKINPDKTAMIGERIGTDLWGAYISGISHRILVLPFSEVFPSKKPVSLYRILRKFEFWLCRPAKQR
ncbi:HAD hydrolase-like protein [Candidatus Woesearchaeota archaeon]|nr:HAD hydrolase-like protein [Candidatus Woesearchaeota archaeon]